MGQKAVQSHADGKKHQAVAGKLHSVELIIQFVQAKSDKTEEKSKTGIWGNL